MTHIALYTQHCTTRGCCEDRGMETYLSQILGAVKFAKQHDCELLMLPGHSLGNVCRIKVHERTQYIDQGIAELQNIADKYDISLLGEVGNTYYFRPHQSLSQPMEQTLFRGIHRTKEPQLVADFQNALNSGNRSTLIGKQEVCVILCGEQNILKVPNSFIPEFPENFDWSWNYDLLLNPGHDSMGQWNRIGKRFIKFSRDNRTAIHVTNNLHKNSWSTAIRVYKNGELILDGNFEYRDEVAKYIEDNWRVVAYKLP